MDNIIRFYGLSLFKFFSFFLLGGFFMDTDIRYYGYSFDELLALYCVARTFQILVRLLSGDQSADPQEVSLHDFN